MGGRGLQNGGNRVVEKIDDDKIAFGFTRETQNWLDVCAILGPIVYHEGNVYTQLINKQQVQFVIEKARTFFSRVTGEITSKLSRLNSSSNELDAAERLDVLRGFFRPDEAALPFDLQSAMRRGHNLKDTICPDSLEFHRDYFKMGSQYGRVLFLKDYASYIKDSMILELTDLNRRMMLSIDMIPVPTDEAVREVENKLLGVETNVTNWQRRQNSNLLSAPYSLIISMQRYT